MTWALILVAAGIVIGIVIKKHAGLVACGVITVIVLVNLDKIIKTVETAFKVGRFGRSIGLW